MSWVLILKFKIKSCYLQKALITTQNHKRLSSAGNPQRCFINLIDCLFLLERYGKTRLRYAPLRYETV